MSQLKNLLSSIKTDLSTKNHFVDVKHRLKQSKQRLKHSMTQLIRKKERKNHLRDPSDNYLAVYKQLPSGQNTEHSTARLCQRTHCLVVFVHKARLVDNYYQAQSVKSVIRLLFQLQTKKEKGIRLGHKY